MGILVLGAGGHGKVAADILRRGGRRFISETVLGFLDDDETTWGATRLGLPVLGAIAQYAQFQPTGLVMGIGSNKARSSIVERLNADALWQNAIHPTAILAESARIGRGVLIAAGAIINPDAVIGDFAVINTGTTIDHDCSIGAYAHIAPGVNLAGGVQVGEGTLVGIGAKVIPYTTIGAWAVIGAGAVVVRAVPDGATAMGVPARW
jgi:sugar O-acyltransferase (sialic acid O-acetyltransferase NeuD family)